MNASVVEADADHLGNGGSSAQVIHVLVGNAAQLRSGRIKVRENQLTEHHLSRSLIQYVCVSHVVGTSTLRMY